MSNLSLAKSIRSCKVESGEANRIRSDRFLNPHNMMCPVWNGVNLKGQEVCPDSFYTKSAGCNSATDRVDVENFLRPEYTAYVTLDAAGIDGNIYGNVNAHDNVMARQRMVDSRTNGTGYDKYLSEGNFGFDYGASIRNHSCTVNAYENAMRQEAQSMRGQNYMQNGYQGYSNMSQAGMRIR